MLTDLLLKGSTPVARRIFNALAEEPETVAEFLVPRMRESDGSDAPVEYLTLPGAVQRMAAGLPQILCGGRFFDADGQRVKEPGSEYQPNGVRKLY